MYLDEGRTAVEASSFAESNLNLNPPEGVDLDDCQVLSVFRGEMNGQSVVVSCWKATAEELEEIRRTGRVWLFLWGVTMPPAWLSGIKPAMTAGREARDETG